MIIKTPLTFILKSHENKSINILIILVIYWKKKTCIIIFRKTIKHFFVIRGLWTVLWNKISRSQCWKSRTRMTRRGILVFSCQHIAEVRSGRRHEFDIVITNKAQRTRLVTFYEPPSVSSSSTRVDERKSLHKTIQTCLLLWFALCTSNKR